LYVRLICPEVDISAILKVIRYSDTLSIINTKYYNRQVYCIDGKGEVSLLQIPCQDHRFKHLNFQYIYPISYKNAKKRQTPEKGFALIQKRYHTNFKASKTCHL
jgi:hypothetical protein